METDEDLEDKILAASDNMQNRPGILHRMRNYVGARHVKQIL
jgi:hypothetical protein